jgi:hypothetical protein
LKFEIPISRPPHRSKPCSSGMTYCQVSVAGKFENANLS